MYAEKCVPGVGVIQNLYVNFLLRTEMYGRIVDETFDWILPRGSTRLFLPEDLEVQNCRTRTYIEGATPALYKARVPHQEHCIYDIIIRFNIL